MQHTRLPIYKKGCELVKLAVLVQQQMPRGHKRNLGEKIMNHCTDMVDLMALANASKGAQRADYIRTLLQRVHAVQVLLRVCFDLRLIAKECRVDVETIKRQTKAKLKPAKPPAELAAQPQEGEGGAKKPEGKATAAPKKSKPAAPAQTPKTSKVHAAAQIAAALQEAEGSQIKAPTAQGNEAPAASLPVAPSAEAAGNGAGLDIGKAVKILPNASGVKQRAMVGKHGTIQRKLGPEAWDVRFPSKRDPNIGQFVGFHTSELEVLP